MHRRGPEVAHQRGRVVGADQRLTDEHRLIAQTVADFVNGEVLPVLDRLEAKDWVLSRQLIRRCGDLGFTGVDVAEAYAWGWEELGRRIPVRCFTHDPSVSSSLTFLRRTPWARSKVESLYLQVRRPGSA